MRITLLWLGLLSCVTVHSQTNNALSFNGSSDKVLIGKPIPANTSYTKEAWVFLTSNSLGRNIISSLSNPLWVSSGFLQAGHGNAFAIVSDPSLFPVGRWVHVAVTYDQSTRFMRLYRDGQLVGIPVYTLLNYTANEDVFIGSHEGTLSFWHGSVDEARIWHRALSQTEIVMRMYRGPEVTANGLQAYYKMNEPSSTTLDNVASPGNGLTGTITGAVKIASPIEGRANALQFDGTDDYINIGTGASLKMTGAVTNEAWVKAANWSAAGVKTITSCFEVGGYGLTLENSSLRFTVRTNGAYYFASVPQSSLTNNTWYHIAGTFDGRYVRLYLNGVLVNTNDLGAGVKTIQYSFPGNSMMIGAEAGPANAPVGDYFGGEIDEVRIWDVARTAPQLLANIGNELDPSDAAQTTGLVAYYTFNQGITAGTNTGLVSAPDMKGTNTGTLINFGLTGSVSNYTQQPLVLIALPVQWNYFTAQPDRNGALLNWSTAQEQHSKEFEIQHSPDGVNWSAIGIVAAAGNSSVERKYSFTHSTPLNGANYYRLRQKDLDGKISYSEVRRLVFSATSKEVILQGNLVINGRIGVQVSKTTTVSVFSTDGKLILRKPLAPGFHNVEINAVTKGIYWFSAGSTIEKILVQ